jgi:heme A synthase
MLVGLVYTGWEERRPSILLVATAATGVAYVVQALIGAANIWTELAAGGVVAHLSFAALLWSALVAISTLAFYMPGVRATASGDAARRDAEVTGWAR